MLCSKQFGLRWIIEQAWEELGYNEVLQELQAESGHRFNLERAVFAMVLQQIIAPNSKRYLVEEWLGQEVFFPEAEGMNLQQVYRAMDVLEECYPLLEARLRERLEAAGLSTKGLNVDTTSVFFAVRYDDRERAELAAKRKEAVRRAVINEPPLRLRGNSKDYRPDAPQVVLESVVGDHGLVLHHETHPGNTPDVSLTKQTLEWAELAGLAGKLIVGDSGMNSREVRDKAREAGFDFVFGQADVKHHVVRKALKSKGRYRSHPERPELQYKPVVVEHEGEKLLIVLRRHQGERRAALYRLEQHLQHIRQELDRDDRAAGHTKRICNLLTHGSYRKFVRRSKRAKNRLIIDSKAVELERRTAGVSAISTSLEEVDPAFVDGLYENLGAVESAFKLLKSGLEVRPVRHRKDTRIRAHNMINVMALNIVRWLELKSARSWRRLRIVFQRLRVQEIQIGQQDGWQTVELDEEQEAILRDLGYQAPLRRFHVEWAATSKQ